MKAARSLKILTAIHDIDDLETLEEKSYYHSLVNSVALFFGTQRVSPDEYCNLPPSSPELQMKTLLEALAV